MSNLDNLRHSTSHLMASAVKEIWPNVKIAIGPSIENGFYYDFDFGKTKISESDFPKIESTMKAIVKDWKDIKGEEISEKKAKEIFRENSYKLELIKDLVKEGKKIKTYKSGNFIDLCGGGHIENPSKDIKHFKLLSVAGAYWRGNEKKKMLTRIYGTVFPTKKELDSHLEMLEEVKKRDHRKIGKELNLFMFHETSPGAPYWLNNGLVIYNELLNFWRVEHQKRGYKEIASPLVNKKELWETSGHWDHFKEDMFIADMGENEVYGIKPMNCPNAMLVFGSTTRSYKDLPLRLSDSDTLHRYERSGTLNGLFRVRSFKQDDSHNFVTESQIESEYGEILKITELFYSIFGLEYKYRLGTRPEKFLGDKKTWDKAEASLKKILEKSKKEYSILEGDGAFYGPKIDIIMKDALQREWQMGTIQLDFQLPSRFKLKYVDKNGDLKTPIAIHRVIYGSMERFIGILIEHFAGSFPVWISPVQVKILPITEKQLSYAKKVADKIKESGIRVEVDERSETLQAKIRDAQIEKVPYMAIVGGKEESEEKVAIRLRSGKDKGMVEVSEFIKNIKKIIDEKSLQL